MSDQEHLTCAFCGQQITDDERDFCLADRERFKGLVFCFEHQKRFNACPAMRWQPGQGGPIR